MNNHKITNLATPTASTDAATKGYVDSAGGSLVCQTFTSSGTGNATATCTSGTATGGGCYMSHYIAAGKLYFESRPEGNGWYCRLYNCSSGTCSRSVTAYVVCCSI